MSVSMACPVEDHLIGLETTKENPKNLSNVKWVKKKKRMSHAWWVKMMWKDSSKPCRIAPCFPFPYTTPPPHLTHPHHLLSFTSSPSFRNTWIKKDGITLSGRYWVLAMDVEDHWWVVDVTICNSKQIFHMQSLTSLVGVCVFICMAFTYCSCSHVSNMYLWFW